ncbi:Putative F420H(2)-dependent quinone reductase [Frankliniella fusca]|uniref:F420H(2)-dependent quinone reductase n=1 Tax=Frankliniella fusca TaxID=407009 RepID=A0AAE1H4E1_9NEOP|nr:Putative F420H(2)-dependent quinone reductase [Frankliniella fusca]
MVLVSFSRQRCPMPTMLVLHECDKDGELFISALVTAELLSSALATAELSIQFLVQNERVLLLQVQN